MNSRLRLPSTNILSKVGKYEILLDNDIRYPIMHLLSYKMILSNQNFNYLILEFII